MQIFHVSSLNGPLRKNILAISIILHSFIAFSQPSSELGRPFLTNYSPNLYDANPQNWDIVQDNRGVMYFGNTEGVLEYDGYNWRLIKLPNNSVVRTLACDRNGRVWIGGSGEFGYLAPDDTGKMSYVSLVGKIHPEEERDFNDVWGTYVHNDDIYFSTFSKNFRYSGDSVYVNIPLDSNRFEFLIALDNSILKWVGGKGLFKKEADEFIMLPGSEILQNNGIADIHPFNETGIMILTRRREFFLYDGQSMKRLEYEAMDEIRQYNPRRFLPLPNDQMAIGTLNGGIFIVGSNGKILHHYQKANGLQDNVVYGMYLDMNDALWIAMDNGIARFPISSPLTYFNTDLGLTSNVMSLKRYHDVLYVGTTEGASYLDPSTGTFKPVENVGFQCFSMIIVNDQLLTASQNGVQTLQKDHKVSMDTIRTNSLALYESKKHPGYVFVGTTNGAGIINVPKGRKYEVIGRFEGVNDGIWSFAEDEEGRLWLGTESQGAIRITFNNWPDPNDITIERYSADNGLPFGQLYLYKVGETVYFMPFNGIFTFDDETKQFARSTTFGEKASTMGTILTPAGEEEVYLSNYKGAVLANKNEKGEYDLISSPFKPFENAILTNILPEDDGITWFATSVGLIRYDANMDVDYKSEFNLLIRNVTVNEDSVLFYGTNKKEPTNYVLDYGLNNLTFSYASPFYVQESMTEYKTWLEGYDKDWSDWSNRVDKEYTNLREGNYTFHVIARNIYETESSEATFDFRITPPLHRTIFAYIIYVVFGGIFIWLIVRYRTGQLKAQQKVLEDTVRERTAELSQRVEELAVINSVQQGLVAEMDMQGIYDLVGDRIVEIFDAQIATIVTFDFTNNAEVFHFVFEDGKKHYPQPRPIDSLRQYIIRTKEKFILNFEDFDSLKDKGIDMPKPVPGTIMPKSSVFIPMIVGENVKGYVTLQNLDYENAYSDSDISLMETLANSMSVALENARLFNATQQSAAEMATVANITNALASQLDLDALIQMVGEQMKELFQANIVFVAILDKQSNMINFPFQHGDEIAPIKFGEGLTSSIIKSGEPALINQDVNARYAELGIQRAGKESASFLGVPIISGKEIIGVISVQSTEQENRFNKDDMRLLSMIASNVGVAIHTAKLFDETLKAQAEAEEARKIAEEANEAKSAFLSTVSHELRTPLTSVIGFAKIIRKRLHDKIFPLIEGDEKINKTKEQISQNLDVVVSEGERLTTLINDVLDLAKIEAGKMEWHMDNIQVGEIIDRAMSATASVFDAKKLKRNVKIAKNLPVIQGDQDKLIQVIINLLSNAAKFTDKGTVTCKAVTQDNEIIVSIEDTGMGIAQEDQLKVFDKFKQVGDTLTDKPKGTGLGLPICKEIIEYHGGRIWVESELKKGSTFSFSLPLSKTEEMPFNLNDLVKQLKRQVLHNAPKMSDEPQTILVVDDEEHIRNLLKQELSDNGFIVREAKNGKEAIEEVRKELPDLVILDVMMPEMNGFDVAAVLKNDPITMDIPILILSIVQDKERGYRLGVDRYLTKPIDTDQLFKEVGTLLEQGKSKRKVMIVDEDTSTVKTLAEVLQTRGYSVVESNGLELVQKAIESKPDIIILNSVMSKDNEMIKALRFEKGLENVLFMLYQQ